MFTAASRTDTLPAPYTTRELKHLRKSIVKGRNGAERADTDTRVLAARGLDAMAVRHPERLGKIIASALGDDLYTYRAVGVLAEYARTRRTEES